MTPSARSYRDSVAVWSSWPPLFRNTTVESPDHYTQEERIQTLASPGDGNANIISAVKDQIWYSRWKLMNSSKKISELNAMAMIGVGKKKKSGTAAKQAPNLVAFIKQYVCPRV